MHLKRLHALYIQNTRPTAFITLTEIQLCNLTFSIKQVLEENQNGEKSKVFVTTRMLKHLYDKKPAEEYDAVVRNMYTIVRYPDEVYISKDRKRGDFAFVKSVEGLRYFSSIEQIKDRYYVVTCFRLRKETYLEGYRCIWSWKGDGSFIVTTLDAG